MQKLLTSVFVLPLLFLCYKSSFAEWSMRSKLNKNIWKCEDLIGLTYEIKTDEAVSKDLFLYFVPYLNFFEITIRTKSGEPIKSETIELKANYESMNLLRPGKDTVIKVPFHFKLKKDGVLENVDGFILKFHLGKVKEGSIEAIHHIIYSDHSWEIVKGNPLHFKNECIGAAN